jgi:hypothetical protein
MLAPQPARARAAEAPADDGPVEDRRRPAPGSDDPWAVDGLLGVPTGIRLQRDLLSDDGRALVAEGFFGLEVICPTAGLGARCRLPLCRGECDSLVVAPGADAYILLNPFPAGGRDVLFGGPAALPLFTGDVDLLWRHRWGNYGEGECGLKLGAGAVRGDSWVVIPVASLIGGWCF